MVFMSRTLIVIPNRSATRRILKESVSFGDKGLGTLSAELVKPNTPDTSFRVQSWLASYARPVWRPEDKPER